jgi:hypothetical protein
MLLTSLIALVAINTIDLGVKFGPTFPSGNLQNNYKVTTTTAGFCAVNNFVFDYSFSKFTNKINQQENLYLHSAVISYQYPAYQKNCHQINVILGGSYNYIRRRWLTANEQTYALGLRYGVGYKLSFSSTSSEFVERLQPALHTNIYLNQIVQLRDWNYNQIMSSNFLFSIMLGVSFRIL